MRAALRPSFFDREETMNNSILYSLTAQDDKAACAFAEKIIQESQQSHQWYPFLEEFASLLHHKKIPGSESKHAHIGGQRPMGFRKCF